MNLSKKTIIALVVAAIALILAICVFVCKKPQSSSSSQENSASTQDHPVEKAEVLPYLNLTETKASYAVPFCEKKNCIDVDIQTIKTQDAWLNSWIEKIRRKLFRLKLI